MINLFTSQLFLTCLSAWFTAHLIKFIIALVKEGNIKALEQFFSSGGFPSGHTTLVTTLFVFIGMSEGWTNTLTAISGITGVIVIYDALNIRFQAGLHARALNKIGAKNPLTGKIFKESLGHTYLEVLGGIILGTAFAVISYSAF